MAQGEKIGQLTIPPDQKAFKLQHAQPNLSQ